jgi:hypothetical protein
MRSAPVPGQVLKAGWQHQFQANARQMRQALGSLNAVFNDLRPSPRMR